jgi:hypothetical protein
MRKALDKSLIQEVVITAVLGAIGAAAIFGWTMAMTG